MKYIVSKLSFDQSFTVHSGNRAPYATVKEILVKGKSNVRDPRTLITPSGVITELSDADAAIVENHSLYKMYEKNGMMKITSSKVGARSAKKDLDEKDGSAQLTADDFKDKGLPPPQSVSEAKANDGDEDDDDDE